MPAKEIPPYTVIDAFRCVKKERLLQLLNAKVFQPTAKLLIQRRELRGRARRKLIATFGADILAEKNRVIEEGYTKMEFAVALAVVNKTVSVPD